MYTVVVELYRLVTEAKQNVTNCNFIFRSLLHFVWHSRSSAWLPLRLFSISCTIQSVLLAPPLAFYPCMLHAGKDNWPGVKEKSLCACLGCWVVCNKFLNSYYCRLRCIYCRVWQSCQLLKHNGRGAQKNCWCPVGVCLCFRLWGCVKCHLGSMMYECTCVC